MNIMLVMWLVLMVASFTICFYIYGVMKLAFVSSVREGKGPALLLVLGLAMALALIVGCLMARMVFKASYYLLVYT
jgi:hypothetical protein